VHFLFDAGMTNSMRYGANVAAIGLNVPIAILFALSTRPGRTLPTAVCVLIVVGLIGLAVWKFPKGEKRSSFEWFTFLSVLGSALLWSGIFLLAINGDSLPSMAYTGLEVLIFGGIALVLGAVFGSYISIRKERGF
jgi:predicted membrane channel-forming protein YqfA (hemolysin III family)